MGRGESLCGVGDPPVGPALAHRTFEQDGDPATATSPAMTPSTAAAHQGLLYGRITTDDGEIYEGRLRWGGDEEALWSNYFNGVKEVNPWVAHAPLERLPKERFSIAAARAIALW